MVRANRVGERAHEGGDTSRLGEQRIEIEP
jgi:hypothetical protein